MSIDLRSLADSSKPEGEFPISNSVDDLLLASLDRGGDNLETGRYLVTFNEGQESAGLKQLRSCGVYGADSRDFANQDVEMETLGDGGSLYFSEVNAALISGSAFREIDMAGLLSAEADSGAIASIEPEYFVFAYNSDYLRGFARAAQVIAEDLGKEGEPPLPTPPETPDPPSQEVLGATWGLVATRGNVSNFSGSGLKVAILDTGFDLGHPDFVGRPIVSATFVGQPVQDLNGHGTHCTGTACGPKAPAGTTPRYGIAHQSNIHIGKVLSNSGGGTTATVLAGMNWAIAQGCQVISMSLGGQIPVQTAYTNAGNIALSRGLLIVAAAGNAASNTGAPANSPSIMAVASLDSNLRPSSFSNFGKIEIAGPGRDVFSSWPRPQRYNTISGTSMAAPHVAGCAALWAQSNPSLRGKQLWNKLQATARRLPFPATAVGAGLVQAP
jgi:subtilisin family serine protease